ncbi:hypothetical protein HDV00_001089 [Rhizophlyctis rosea]|nr:hypothetical protein HDV00_001089 [Rhizophlyctis rosea]
MAPVSQQSTSSAAPITLDDAGNQPEIPVEKNTNDFLPPDESLEVPQPPADDGDVEEESVVARYSVTKSDDIEVDGVAIPTSATPTMTPSKISQMVPLRDLEDVRAKLRVLEQKRAEDRERLLHLERLRTDLESSHVVRTKLSAKLAEVTADANEAKRLVRDMTAEKETLEVAVQELQEALEMAVLDKDVAEETAEVLRGEVAALEEKCGVLELDVEVLKGENELLREGINPDEDGATPAAPRPPVEIVQLEKQNDRLKEALIRLRDMTAEQEVEMSAKLHSLEEEISTIAEQKEHVEGLKHQLERAEFTIEELKNRLDDCLGAEELVEKLTERNMQLKEKIDEMTVAIQDLEALKDLSDELEEDHMETEKVLIAEIDYKDGLIRDLARRINSQEEALADYERTIHQFRELVKNLQSDLVTLREAGPDSTDPATAAATDTLSSQTQAMLSLNLQLQTTVTKARAKAVELELRRLDVAQAKDHLELIKPFLPETFWGGEDASIETILLFKRIVFKCDVVMGRLEESGRVEKDEDEKKTGAAGQDEGAERGAGGDAEAEAFGCEMRQKLTHLAGVSRRLIAYMETCPVESYVSMARTYHEVVAMEKRLDSMMEILKKEDLRGEGMVLEVQRATSRLEHLSDQYLGRASSSPANAPQLHPAVIQQIALELAKGLEADANRVDAELARALAAFIGPEDDIDEEVAESVLEAAAGFMESWDEMRDMNRSVRTAAKKLLRRLTDLAENSATVRQEVLWQLRELSAASGKIVECCASLATQTTDHVRAQLTRKQRVTLESLERISRLVSEQVLLLTESKSGGGIGEALKKLGDGVVGLVEVCEDGRSVEKVTKTQAPWLVRAEEVKTGYRINVELQKRVEALEAEVVALVKQANNKEELVQESAVKIEFLERKLENVKKQVDTIAQLEEDLGKSKQQSVLYEEAIEALHADLEQMEKENAQLKKVARRMEKQGGGMSPMRRPAVGSFEDSFHAEMEDLDNGSDEVVDGNVAAQVTIALVLDKAGNGLLIVGNHLLFAQIESLKAALRFLRAENSRLKAHRAYVSASSLFDPSDPLMRRANTRNRPIAPTPAPSSPTPADADEAQDTDEPADLIRSLAMDARLLLRDVRAATAAPRVVDITRAGGAGGKGEKSKRWSSLREDPIWQIREREGRDETLRKRGEELWERVKRIKGVMTRGGMGGFGEDEISFDKERIELLGRVKVPALAPLGTKSRGNFVDRNGSRCLIVRRREEFETIHNIFVT